MNRHTATLIRKCSITPPLPESGGYAPSRFHRRLHDERRIKMDNDLLRLAAELVA
jgi:hypothetical protein